jgi:ribosomal protein L7/L12
MWDTNFGKVIRWAVYLPAAILLLLIVEVVFLIYSTWLFGSMSTFVIVGLLFGGIGFLFMGPVAYYAVVIFTTQTICPAPRVGAIAFATLYLLWSACAVASLTMSELHAGEFLLLALIRAVFAITAISAVVNVYSSDVSRQLQIASSAAAIPTQQRLAAPTTKANKFGPDARHYIDATAENIPGFDVVLEAIGDRKIGVIKVLREATGLELKEAKDLVERAPSKVMVGISKLDALFLKLELESVGARISIKGPWEDSIQRVNVDDGESEDENEIVADACSDIQDDEVSDELDELEDRLAEISQRLCDLQTRTDRSLIEDDASKCGTDAIKPKEREISCNETGFHN